MCAWRLWRDADIEVKAEFLRRLESAGVCSAIERAPAADFDANKALLHLAFAAHVGLSEVVVSGVRVRIKPAMRDDRRFSWLLDALGWPSCS